ncbi:hypothetical protein ABZY05_33470 [Streptomyces canus]|uniref:hypothetical protein n=1 Tax=Streptomyces canus TaxID=58343 RepID=UPI0033B7C4CD
MTILLACSVTRRGDLEQDGIRLVYDGTALRMSTASAPEIVIARTATFWFVSDIGEGTDGWDFPDASYSVELR